MNTTAEYTDPYPFEDFAPTLSQCFILVLIGYLLSKLEFLTSSDVKGVLSMSSYFAMPGFMCASLMDADFSDFRWELIFGILVGKFVTFVFVAGFWILLKGNIGVAAVLALSCIQTNELPVGIPLMSSLYRDYRPQMVKYLLPIPAMTVILFVPVSNIMINIHRKMRKKITLDKPNVQKYWWKYIEREYILNQIREIAKTPLVIATLCGFILNVAFKGNAPEVFHQPIKVTAGIIPGIALVMVSFSFVRKERHLLSSAVVPAAVLFTLKMVITPIMLHAIVRVMTEEPKSSNWLSDFSLFYGIMPPATTIFQFGGEFRKAQAAMSVTLILSSLTCFPLSYVVARATIVPVQKWSNHVPALKDVLFWTACISLCSYVITGITIMWKNQRQKISSYILYLILMQVTTCCGLILWSIRTERQTWTVDCDMVLYYGGEISGYLWTATLAVVLISENKNWMLARRTFFIISCTAFSVSALITTIMCFLIPYNDVPSLYVVADTRSDFEFLQLMTSSILLFTSLVVVAVCLMCYFKSNERAASKTIEECAYDNTVFYLANDEEINHNQNSKELAWSEKVLEDSEEKNVNKIREEIRKNEVYQQRSLSVEEREWTFRLSSLLILLFLVMLVRFVSNLFKLVRNDALEAMIPMEFLQSTLFIGQGIFILLTFGVDVRTIIISMKKWCRRITHKDNYLPTYCKYSNTMDEGQAGQFCSQFCKFYYSRCFTDIAKERRWKDNIYKDSFWGPQLIDWFISEGLCQDDVDAESQGQKLLEGGVIQHISQKHHFYDAPYLYQFVKRSSVMRSCNKF